MPPFWLSLFLAPVLALADEPASAAKPAAEPVPAAEAKPAADAILDAPSWLGVTLDTGWNLDLDDDEKPPPGVGVVGVMDGGPAQKAGLKQYDRVLKIDGKVLKEMEELRTAVRAIPAGREITLRILRDGKERDVRVTLEKMPLQMNQGFMFGPGNVPAKPDKVFFYSVPQRATDPNGPDVVALRDGNRLEGKVLAMNDTGLTFKLAGGPEVPLMLSEVVTIHLAGTSRAKGLPASVLLRGGGWLAAAQVKYEGGKFSVALDKGARVDLDRAKVAEVAFSKDEPPAFYSSPAMLDGWRALPQKAWAYEGGVWKATSPQGGMLGRKFANLPSSIECDFEVQAPQQGPFHVALFTYRSDAASGNASPGMVQIQWHGSGVQVTHHDGQRFHTLPTVKTGEGAKDLRLDAGKAVRHSIFCDRSTGLLVLKVNDVEVGQYEIGKVSAEDLPRAGRVIQFVGPENFAVSRVTVRPWIGALPKDGAGQAAQDVVAVSAAKEELLGEITGITDTEILMAGRAPIQRTKPMIVKFHSPAPAQERQVGGVWMETKSGSGIIAESASIAGGIVKARTAFAGELSFPLEDLLTFQLHRPGDSAPAKAKPGGLDILTFSSGRQLTGTFAPAVAGDRLSWKISAARQPLDFPLTEVASLLLAPKEEPAAGAPHVVRLRNGDWLTGEVKAMDATSITMNTAFREGLKIGLANINTLYPSPAASAVADGGSGRKRWKESVGGNVFQRATLENDDAASPAFAYSDGAYTLRRIPSLRAGNENVAMPVAWDAGPLSIEFTVSGFGNAAILQLLDPHKAVAYSLFYSGTTVQMTRMNTAVVNAGGVVRNRPEQFSFKLPGVPQFGNSTLRVRMMFDPGAPAIHLFFDGKMAGTCKLRKDTPWTEVSNVIFSAAFSGSNALSISDVWVAPWDGRLHENAAPKAGEVAITLANGDDMIGRLTKLDADELEVENEAAGSLTLPLSRIRTMEFQNPMEPRKAAYRVRLYDRGLISADELKMSGDKLVLKTPLGDLTVPFGMVKEITFAKPGGRRDAVAP